MKLKATYRDMGSRIRNLEPYAHASSAGARGPREYVIVSYTTPIAVARLKDDGSWEYRLNARKYSATTSRLQNIIRRAWERENSFVEVDELD